MSYPEKQLNGYVLLVDAQGSATADIAAPDAGQTLLYTTEQGIMVERYAAAPLVVNQWFLDQPALLENAPTVTLTNTPQSLLDAPYTIPDDIGAAVTTLYRIDVQVSVNNFAAAATSAAIVLQAFVDGVAFAAPVLIPCDGVAGIGGGFATLFAGGSVGNEIDIRARLLDAGDAADCDSVFVIVKRELRVSV